MRSTARPALVIRNASRRLAVAFDYPFVAATAAKMTRNDPGGRAARHERPGPGAPEIRVGNRDEAVLAARA